MKYRSHLPAVGATGALVCFVAATARYPGGTDWAIDTVGYRWSENFVCSLLQAQALNGADNDARPLAITALWLLCVSLAVLFFRISRSTTSRRHRSAIEIGGIGMAVYSALLVTPMHNLMVTMGLMFGLVAFGAMLDLLRRERRAWLVVWGAALVLVQVACAVCYYGNAGFERLPVLQKLGLVIGVPWLLAVHYRQRPGEKGRAS